MFTGIRFSQSVKSQGNITLNGCWDGSGEFMSGLRRALGFAGGPRAL